MKIHPNNRKHLFESIEYVGLLMFFTYTSVAVGALKGDACIEYVQLMASPLSLVTNFGLILMLMIDYQSLYEIVEGKMLTLLSCMFFTVILIYAHATIVGNPERYKDYVVPLSVPWLFGLLHFCVVLYLIYLKYYTLREDIASEEV